MSGLDERNPAGGPGSESEPAGRGAGMNRRPQRQSPSGGGFEKTPQDDLPADPTLVTLLQASLDAPDGQIWELPHGRFAVTKDQLESALAIRERCKQLGGEPMPHLERALQAMLRRRR